jgi:hypothetical protein
MLRLAHELIDCLWKSIQKLQDKKPVMPRLSHELIDCLWKSIQKLQDKEFLDLVDKHSSLLFVAAELGNVEFLTILLRSHPDLIWKIDSNNRNLFHISVLHRQESVFNLIYEIGAFKDMIALCVDKNQNTMLHLVGYLAPTSRLKIVSGAVLQMQRELLWFKVCSHLIPISLISLVALSPYNLHLCYCRRSKK